MDGGASLSLVVVLVEYAVKIVAIGTVPANRRPSSGQAWLLLILFLPFVGLPLFLLIGSPYVHGRRHRLQREANQAIGVYAAARSAVPAPDARAGTLATDVPRAHDVLAPAAADAPTTAPSPPAADQVPDPPDAPDLPDLPDTVAQDRPARVSPDALPDPAVRDMLLALNRRLTAMPCVLGTGEGLHADYADSIGAIVRAIDGARHYVHLETYVLALDETTGPVFDALAAAVRRGVTVRVLYDHLGSRKYPGYREMTERLTADGTEWHRMMPIDPLHGRWRRPDLRNHRKLLVVDGVRGFMGSQNMIDPSYLSRKNKRIGRHWVDLNIELTGEIVRSLDVVFATDWYAEAGHVPETTAFAPDPTPPPEPAPAGTPGVRRPTAFQLVPSGPGFPTEPNLRLFTSLIHLARSNVHVVSPYFVPDESLLAALTTAAYRGVRVELFVSEQADQFMVHHAQRSYYHTLLEAGVRIHCYPAPAVLHTKLVTVDERIGLIGSSNMDMRSFALDYEIMLLGLGAEVTGQLDDIVGRYREASFELDLTGWTGRPWWEKYLDNALRLTAALQ